MKITEFNADERRYSAIKGEAFPEMRLLLFSSPVMMRSGDTEKLLGTGCGALLLPNSPLYLSSADGSELRFVSIRFTATASELKYITNLGINTDAPFRLRDNVVMGNILELIRLGSFCSQKNRDDFSDCALRMILISISEQTKYRDAARVPHYFKLHTLRDNVYADPCHARSIDDICNELNISRTYFHRIYTAAFGTSYLQDIISSRVRLAKDLLRTTSMSVSLIAEECGYVSDSYFMRQFRQLEGCTPTEYRRSYTAERD